MRSAHEFFGFNSYLNFWTGVVEDIMDPLTAGRVRVRIHGLHDESRTNLPTNDLLWADILMPVTSATLSGVGHSPTGLKNGSWVAGIFLDGENCQRPLILGSLPGIHKTSSIAPGGGTGQAQQGGGNSGQGGQSGGGLPGSGIPGTGGGGGGSSTFPSNSFPGTGGVVDPSTGRSLNLSAYSPQRVYNSMEGGYASSIRGPDGFAIVRTLEDVRLGRSNYVTLAGNPNQYGKQYVIPSITYVNAQGETHTQTNVTGVVHDTGSAFRNAAPNRLDVPIDRDATNAQMAQSQSIWTNNGVIGIPTSGPIGSGIPSPTQVIGDFNPTGDPSYTTLPDGTIVQSGGYDPAGDPYIGSTNLDYGVPSGFTYNSYENIAYNDPFNYYPTWPSEDMSTDPWARGWPSNPDFNTNSISTTDILREYQRDSGIQMAGGGTWEEPASPNVGQYPKNTVFRTEGGLVMEYDSTPGAERWHLYHPTGSYIEIDSRGNMVTKAHGDRIEIDKGNRFIATTGDWSISSNGSLKLKSGADTFMEVNGNLKQSVNVDMRMDVRGNMTFNCTNAMRLSGKHMTIEGTEGPINLKAAKEINMEATTNMNIQSGADMAIAAKANMYAIATGDVNVQGDKVNLQSGGDLSLYSGADIKMEAANIHSKSDKHKFSGVIHSPNPPKTPDPIGAGDSADGANKAQDAMNSKAQENQKNDRTGGTAGQDVAPHSMTDLNQEVKEDTKQIDRPVVPTKTRPSSSDLRAIQGATGETATSPGSVSGGTENESVGTGGFTNE